MLFIIIKLTLRNLLKNRLYHIIGISGLGIAIACSLFILIWLNYELSYDRHHVNADRLFRFTIEIDRGDEIMHFARISDPDLFRMREYFPEIGSIVRMETKRNARIMIGENLKVGNPGTVLSEPGSVVIAESIARKYFGQENPLGKEIHAAAQHDSTFTMYTITGIMEDFPANSHFHPEILCSFEDPSNVGWAYYYFYSVIEIVMTLLIVWNAVKWPTQEA